MNRMLRFRLYKKKKNFFFNNILIKIIEKVLFIYIIYIYIYLCIYS